MAEPDDVEVARLRLGSYIVGGSILAVVVCLVVVCSSGGTVADKVALLGSVTTFLGAAVGVFFGVNASGSGHARTAASAAEAARATTSVAEAAKVVSESARQVSVNAARGLEMSRSLILQPAGREAAGTGLGATDAQPAEVAEDLAGDPDDEHSRLFISPVQSLSLDTLTRGVIHIATPAPADTLFGSEVISVADAEADALISRSTNKARVTEYLNLLGLGFYDGHGVPTRYCAAGVTWATCKAYCDLNGISYSDTNRLAILRSVLGDVGRLYFKPSAGCQAIMDDAKTRGTFVRREQRPQPGFLVFYNWEGGAHAEHIGIVERGDDDGLHTVEFNTKATSGPNQGDGGAVSRKERPLKFVLGYAKTH